jgi:hypothetical protein
VTRMNIWVDHKQTEVNISRIFSRSENRIRNLVREIYNTPRQFWGDNVIWLTKN